MGAKSDEVVDHKIHPPRNELKIDNRKNNLRIATVSKNGMNRSLNTNNTSGVTGVHWHIRTERWEASIGYSGKLIHLGQYDDFNDAVKARKDAEEKYYGEFSYENSQQLNSEKGA